MKQKTALIFYVLSAYVLVQFIWWGFHLIELTDALSEQSEGIRSRVTMVIGEGAVFILILLIGIWQIRRAIKRDLKLSQRQNNFLLSVTHELKTPLAANKLYIQTVTKRDLSKEQSNQLLNKAIEENDRLERMIDNILNASRLENNVLKLSKEQFDFSQLAKSSVERFRHISGADLHCEVAENTMISGDRLLVETIVNNLIENALKYAGNNVRIEVYAQQQGNKTIFGVKDQGPGVSTVDQSEIFKKFYRSGNEDTRTQKGSGLGLFIVFQLVKLHQGTVTYLDNTPQGANFQIEFNND